MFGVFSVSGFQAQVQKSSESAELALETVPDIEILINEVDDVIKESEIVNTHSFH